MEKLIWVFEHNGGLYDDHYTEIMGVFDSAEKAMEAYPSEKWVVPYADAKTWMLTISNEEWLWVYPLLLDEIYPANYGSIMEK